MICSMNHKHEPQKSRGWYGINREKKKHPAWLLLLVNVQTHSPTTRLVDRLFSLSPLAHIKKVKPVKESREDEAKI